MPRKIMYLCVCQTGSMQSMQSMQSMPAYARVCQSLCLRWGSMVCMSSFFVVSVSFFFIIFHPNRC